MQFASAALLFSAFTAAAAHAAAPCIDFKWDVHQERALFAQTPIAKRAGSEVKSAPTLTSGHLYRLNLKPQREVKFAAPPGRSGSDADFAGLARLSVPADGTYRVSVELPLWIDVALDGALIEPKDYQGQHDCAAPHKIVSFEMKHGGAMVLQLSRASAATVLITLTGAPDRVQ